MRSSERKVLHLVDGLLLAGTPRQLFYYLKNRDERAFGHVVVNVTEGELGEEISKLGVRVISLGIRSKADLSVIPRFARILTKERPAILHTRLFQPNLFGRVMGRLVNVPVIISEEQGVELWKRPWHILADRVSVWMTDVVIANSLAVRERLVKEIGLPADKVSILYTGIDLNAFEASVSGRDPFGDHLGIPKGVPVILCVTRLYRLKGNHVLLEAGSLLFKRIPEARLVIVGDGPERENLLRQARALGIEDRVIFTGLRRDVADLLKHCDLFVSASFEEGLPVAVIEALSMERAVVATDAGGTRELIRHGETGLLVPVGDARALADSVVALLKDRDLAITLGKNGRRLIESHYDWSNLAKEREELYRSLLAKKGIGS